VVCWAEGYVQEGRAMKAEGVLRGQTIKLTGSLPLADGQKVRLSVVAVRRSARSGTAQAVLAAVARSPHLRREDVSSMESAIRRGRMRVRTTGVFE
jgi:hypothetical protein